MAKYGFNLGKIEGLDLSVKTLHLTFDETIEVEFELHYWATGAISWNATAPDPFIRPPQTGGEWDIYPNYHGSSNFVLMGDGISEMAGETHTIKIVGDKVSSALSAALEPIIIPFPYELQNLMLSVVTEKISDILQSAKPVYLDVIIHEDASGEARTQIDSLSFAIKECIGHKEKPAYLKMELAGDSTVDYAFNYAFIVERTNYAQDDFLIRTSPLHISMGSEIFQTTFDLVCHTNTPVRSMELRAEISVLNKIN